LTNSEPLVEFALLYCPGFANAARKKSSHGACHLFARALTRATTRLCSVPLTWWLMEAIHDARIIPLEGRPHLPQSVRTWNGDSLGHREGNTLVEASHCCSPSFPAGPGGR
jgi:hypothetical protein